jgi:hypothetical protein
MTPDEQIESRANLDSQFIDFEERCSDCGRMYCQHEEVFGENTILYVCPLWQWPPKGKGVFVLPEEIS